MRNQTLTRRTHIALLGAAVTTAATAAGAKDTSMIRQILEDSKTQNKSVNLYVRGQMLGGLVTKLADDAVEIRNREYGRIVVRLDSIDAAAMM